VVLGEHEVHTYELNKLSSFSIIRITNALVGSFNFWFSGILDFERIPPGLSRRYRYGDAYPVHTKLTKDDFQSIYLNQRSIDDILHKNCWFADQLEDYLSLFTDLATLFGNGEAEAQILADRYAAYKPFIMTFDPSSEPP